MGKGGKRKGAGRKQGDPTKLMRVPVKFEKQIKAYIEKLKQVSDPDEATRNFEQKDTAKFAAAYNAVGRPYVEIYKLRSALGWSVDRFDDVLADLVDQGSIILQGGDPSALTKKQISNSYMDAGNLRIAVSWVHD